jgi:hypothetical protein
VCGLENGLTGLKNAQSADSYLQQATPFFQLGVEVLVPPLSKHGPAYLYSKFHLYKNMAIVTCLKEQEGEVM